MVVPPSTRPRYVVGLSDAVVGVAGWTLWAGVFGGGVVVDVECAGGLETG
jgi:hypothetical protein